MSELERGRMSNARLKRRTPETREDRGADQKQETIEAQPLIEDSHRELRELRSDGGLSLSWIEIDRESVWATLGEAAEL